MEQPLSPHDQHLIDFNRALHGLPGKPWQDSEDPCWKFPEYKDAPDPQTYRVDYCVINEVPPIAWLSDRKEDVDAEQAKKAGLVTIDMPETGDLIPDNGQAGTLSGTAPAHPENLSHNEAGWRIIRCVRRLVSEKYWESHLGWKEVIDRVFAVGEPYVSQNPLPRDVEVDWKYQVFDKLNLKIVV
jgi:hypothetical protein